MAYDLLSSDTGAGRVHRHSGITTTVSSFFLATDAYPLAWDGGNVIVGESSGGTVNRHDGFSSSILDTVSFGHVVNAMHWDRDNGYLLTLNQATDAISRYDGFSTSLVDSVTITDANGGVTLDSDGNLIVTTWVGTGAGAVKRFDGFSTTLVDSFSLSHTNSPRGLAWDPDTGNIIIGEDNPLSSADDSIHIHDGFSATILSTFDAPSTQLRGLALAIPPVTSESEGWGMLI